MFCSKSYESYENSYENSLDKFDIEHCRIKVKATVGIQSFPIYHNTNCLVL